MFDGTCASTLSLAFLNSQFFDVLPQKRILCPSQPTTTRTMRYPSNTHRRLSSSSITNVCTHTAALTPQTGGFRRSASLGCPCWPSSSPETMPVTVPTKRQAHSAAHMPVKATLKRRALANRSHSLHEELACLNFNANDGREYPHLLMPPLASDQKENKRAIRLAYRASRPPIVETKVVPELPLMPTLDDCDEDDHSICLSPRSTLQPLFEPPAPPSGEGHHIIQFDASELSSDLYLPLDGW